MRSNRIDIDLGKKIESLRKKHGETQPQLQKAMGLSHRETITQWECGERQVKAEYLVKLAKHYGVSVDYLLGLYPYPSIKEDVKQVTKYTGLSDGAVERLHNMKTRIEHESSAGWKYSPQEMELNAVNMLLESDYQVLLSIYEYVMGQFDSFVIQSTDENGNDVEIADKEVWLHNKHGGSMGVDIRSMESVLLFQVQDGLRLLRKMNKEDKENG